MSTTFERLSDTLEIAVSKVHRFGTDAFLLSAFAEARRTDQAVDLGTGCGIIPLLWYRWREQAPKLAYGVDIQPEAIGLFTQTVERSGLQSQVIPLCSDLKELKGKIPFGSFTLVTCNPPYKAANTGILNEKESHTIARHEVSCGIEDICCTASKLLQFGGRFCVCQRPERLLDTLEAMRRNRLEPKRVRFVQKKGDTAPWLFLAEGRRGGKPYLKVEPPLLIQDGQGGFSEELRSIYWPGPQQESETGGQTSQAGQGKDL